MHQVNAQESEILSAKHGTEFVPSTPMALSFSLVIVLGQTELILIPYIVQYAGVCGHKWIG